MSRRSQPKIKDLKMCKNDTNVSSFFFVDKRKTLNWNKALSVLRIGLNIFSVLKTASVATLPTVAETVPSPGGDFGGLATQIDL